MDAKSVGTDGRLWIVRYNFFQTNKLFNIVIRMKYSRDNCSYKFIALISSFFASKSRDEYLVVEREVFRIVIQISSVRVIKSEVESSIFFALPYLLFFCRGAIEALFLDTNP